MIDNRINTFLKVCETMNYTAAAKLLTLHSLRYPSISDILKAIMELPLFAYDKKQLSLTPQGERYCSGPLRLCREMKHG